MLKSKRQVQAIVVAAILAAGLAIMLVGDRRPTQEAPIQIPQDAVWIDVRSIEEYQQGHLQQAPRISYDEIETGVASLGLHKDTPIYLYCAVGGRAGTARRRLEAIGYTNVTNAGGLEDARRLAAGSAP